MRKEIKKCRIITDEKSKNSIILVLLTVLNYLFYLYLCDLINLKINILLLLVPTVLEAVFACVINEKKLRWFNIFIFVANIFVDFVLHNRFINDFYCTINHANMTISEKNYEIVSQFSTNSTVPYLVILFFLILSFVLISSLDIRILLVLYTFTALLLQIVFVQQKSILFIIVVLTIIAIYVYLYSSKNTTISLTVLLLSVLVISISLMNNFETIIHNSNIVTSLRYFIETSDSDLDDVQYEIIMSNPQPCYFKIVTDEKYENVSEWSDTFYWLYKNGFYPQNQSEGLSKLIKIESEDRIIVNQLKGNSIILLPYGVTTAENLSPNSSKIGGQSWVQSDEYFYTFSVISDYLIYPNSMALKLDTLDTSQNWYMSDEQAYRKFIYSQYLSIDEHEKNIISLHLSEDSFMTLSEKKTAVLELMSNVNPTSNSSDLSSNFASELLEKSCSGNQSDYAKLTTELLRYLNVPSRYYEGYVITADMIAGNGENSSVRIDKSNFHAWSEYYLDGIGWLPFETYPDYLDFIKSDDSYKLSAQNTNTTNENSISQTVDNTEIPDDVIDAEENNLHIDIAQYVYLIVAIIIVFFLFWITFTRVYLLLKKHRINNSTFKDKTVFYHKQSVRILLRIYSSKQLTCIDLNELLCKNSNNYLSEKLIASQMVYEKCLFSNQKISEDDYLISYEFYRCTIEFCSKKLSFIKRMFYKFFIGLY